MRDTKTMSEQAPGGPLKVHDAPGQVMGDCPGYAVLMPWGSHFRALAFCYSGTALVDAEEIVRRWNAHADLFEALVRLQGWVDEYVDGVGAEFDEARELARDAIAKAKGDA